jgi:hypothetical protein
MEEKSQLPKNTLFPVIIYNHPRLPTRSILQKLGSRLNIYLIIMIYLVRCKIVAHLSISSSSGSLGFSTKWPPHPSSSLTFVSFLFYRHELSTLLCTFRRPQDASQNCQLGAGHLDAITDGLKWCLCHVPRKVYM